MLGKLNFKEIEAKLYPEWEHSGIHKFKDHDLEAETYVIDSPPPFTSGALHMGHMLSYSYFDFAARYKRMQGYNVLYPQGWDCQGFPTEIKVEKKYGRDLPRKEFLEKAREFTLENIEAMKRQMMQMGFSPDWRFEYRTMDDDYHRKVQHSLLLMFEKGEVYRAGHPVLFCTSCRSAIAKAETDDLERETLLNFVKFEAEEGGESLTIATTRPEYLHACTAVLVHPDDAKLKAWVGKRVAIPLFGRSVEVKADKDVEKDFGSGAVMVCTYGDKTDVQWVYRHNLPVVDALTEGGKLQNAGPAYDGLSAAAGRERLLEDLKAGGLLLKQEKLNQGIKVHDRCGKPTEYLRSQQWFVKLKGTEESIKAAAKEMQWIPEFSLQYLNDWADFIEYDWVISRQRVYGTPIPFYYCEKCGKTYAPDYKKLPIDPSQQPWHGKCDCGGAVIGESATADCWVDSSITPLVIAGWPDDEKRFERLYPSTLRPQGLEIIRTWAFYTIARCLALTGKPPFKQVLINGSVLGKDGKKMSKSLGNYEDPDLLLKKYSADALRQWAALSGAFARDRPFNYKDVDYSQSFLTKLWNASKFVEKSIEGMPAAKEPSKLKLRATDKWLLGRLNRLVKEATLALNGYDYYSAVTAMHNFFWKEFCDYYLEEVKYRVYGSDEESKAAAAYCLRHCLLTTLKLLAPFAPFVTDEIYREMFAKEEGKKSLHECSWPASEEAYINPAEDNIVEVLHSLLGEARKFKAGHAMALNAQIAFASVALPDTLLKDFPKIEEELKAVAAIAELNARGGDAITIELRV